MVAILKSLCEVEPDGSRPGTALMHAAATDNSTASREPKGSQKAQPQSQVSYDIEDTAWLPAQRQEQNMTHAGVASRYVTQTNKDMMHANLAYCVAPRLFQIGCMQQ